LFGVAAAQTQIRLDLLGFASSNVLSESNSSNGIGHSAELRSGKS
jgi:hypothetical protein